MLRYILRRVAYSIPVLVLATMLIFVLVRQFGADPARQRCLHSRDVTCVPREEKALGLDKPLPTQYVNFMGDFLQGKWGTSQRTDQSVAESIRTALWDTSQLAFWGLLFSGTIALAVGVYSANKPYSPGDYLFSGLAFAGIAMPTFWFGLLCIQFFTYDLQKWLGASNPIFYSIPNPLGGGPVDYLRELALPVLVLSVQLIAGWSRYQRSSMLEELNSDYIRTARAKGLTRRKVVWKHGLRNSLSAFVTVVALDVGGLFGGLIITEKVFSRTGMGTLLIDALTNGDTAVILPWMLVTGAIVVLFNLVADVMYGVLDPRVRLS
jgi:ABC-type dipeptide/oligopeptide/nickel transport system permease component